VPSGQCITVGGFVGAVAGGAVAGAIIGAAAIGAPVGAAIAWMGVGGMVGAFVGSMAQQGLDGGFGSVSLGRAAQAGLVGAGVGVGTGIALAGLAIAGAALSGGGMALAAGGSIAGGAAISAVAQSGVAVGSLAAGSGVNYAQGNGAQRGGANPDVQKAASRGSTLHSDKPGNLPDQLRQRYPETEFEFKKPGQAGQDVEVVGGKHPSQYPASDWPEGVNHADFKPNTPGGKQTFQSDQRNKWPDPTHMLPYDPKSGKL
jgi:hypothetical protein